jgi:hypothetical protein
MDNTVRVSVLDLICFIKYETGTTKIPNCLIVMRNSGTLALLMNVLVFPTMSIRLVQDRTIIIGAIEHGKIVSYALRVCY